MTKKQTVLKDLSQLSKINKKRLDLVATEIYQVVFRGDRERAFEPKAKTLVHHVWSLEKLTIRQQQGWHMLGKDIQDGYGKSGSVSSGYGEAHDGGERSYIPRAYVNEAQRRLEDLEWRFLSRREKALLKLLLRNTTKTEENEGKEDVKLEHIGLIRSGYGGEDQARASGVTHIQTLLDRLADFYGY